MITLSKKLREAKAKKDNPALSCSPRNKSISIRDQLLTKEISDIKSHDHSAEVTFDDPNKLHEFKVTVKPDEGMWKGGTFQFSVFVPEEYNIKPPVVKCLTRLWHPNINMDGSVCLSILRDHSLDGSGWAPTRSIKDIIWGLNSIFTDLVDFDDPLNIEAAQQYHKDPKTFQRTVESYLFRYALHR